MNPALPAVPLSKTMRPAALVALVLLTISAGLVVDRLYGMPGQWLVNLIVWAEFIWLAYRADTPLRSRLLACVWISAAGEVTASLLWGIYDYQFHNVPLFVPPGHALLYLLGLIAVSQWRTTRYAQDARLVGFLGHLLCGALLLAALILAYLRIDTVSLVLMLIFIAFMRFGPEKPLYAAMFFLALALELYGTWLGNWHWAARVPGTGLIAPNPPLAAGVFYCALDTLVGAWVKLRSRQKRGDALA
jgi:hypothetical protein